MPGPTSTNEKLNQRDLELRFAEIALLRSETLRSNNSKLANGCYDQLHELKDKMRGLPDRGEAAFKRVVMIDDPHVQVIAAAALLAIDQPFAIRILNQFATSALGLVSFTAEMTVREWEAGRLRDYWA